MLINYIYKLYFEEEPQTIYIGQTNNTERRFKEHLYPKSLKANTPKNNWIKSREARGWKLRMVVLDTAPETSISQLEIIWITYSKQRGLTLKNATAGGEGMKGFSLTAESRKKLSDSKKGDKNYNYGKPQSQATKQKIANTKSSTKYLVQNPAGQKHIIVNLNQFCKEQGLRQPPMSRVANGKQDNYKGWTVTKLAV